MISSALQVNRNVGWITNASIPQEERLIYSTSEKGGHFFQKKIRLSPVASSVYDFYIFSNMWPASANWDHMIKLDFVGRQDRPVTNVADAIILPKNALIVYLFCRSLSLLSTISSSIFPDSQVISLSPFALSNQHLISFQLKSICVISPSMFSVSRIASDKISYLCSLFLIVHFAIKTAISPPLLSLMWLSRPLIVIGIQMLSVSSIVCLIMLSQTAFASCSISIRRKLTSAKVTYILLGMAICTYFCCYLDWFLRCYFLFSIDNLLVTACLAICPIPIQSVFLRIELFYRLFYTTFATNARENDEGQLYGYNFLSTNRCTRFTVGSVSSAIGFIWIKLNYWQSFFALRTNFRRLFRGIMVELIHVNGSPIQIRCLEVIGVATACSLDSFFPLYHRLPPIVQKVFSN